MDETGVSENAIAVERAVDKTPFAWPSPRQSSTDSRAKGLGSTRASRRPVDMSNRNTQAPVGLAMSEQGIHEQQ